MMSPFCPLGKSHSQTLYSYRENLIQNLYLDFHFHITSDLVLCYCPNYSANPECAVPTEAGSLCLHSQLSKGIHSANAILKAVLNTQGLPEFRAVTCDSISGLQRQAPGWVRLCQISHRSGGILLLLWSFKSALHWGLQQNLVHSNFCGLIPPFLQSHITLLEINDEGWICSKAPVVFWYLQILWTPHI